MFKSPAYKKYCAKSAVLTAILSALPMLFYIKDARFSETWLLYLGDALFLFSMFVVIFFLNKTFSNQNTSTGSIIAAGIIITLIAIAIICLVALLLFMIYVPGIFDKTVSAGQLTQAPANIVEDKTSGLLFIVFMNAIFGNFSAGAFASLLMAYSATRNQKGDRKAGII